MTSTAINSTNSSNNEQINEHDEILIKGAKVHNLKNVDVKIPKKQLVVVTGVSGSGKSSLCMDTLFAEGQRRYVESLSSYARQFLGRMNKPEVDYIHGICPAIAVEQKVSTRSSRSTVGTLTEIYDYLRVLFAKIGVTYSPVSGQKVKKHEVTDVVNYCNGLPSQEKVFLMFPVSHERTIAKELDIALQKGYRRALIDGKAQKIETLIETNEIDEKSEVFIIVDRLVMNSDDSDLSSRVADSTQLCFAESGGDCFVETGDGKRQHFNHRFELDGIVFEEPTPDFFNYNNPNGACKTCEGFGTVLGIDPDLVIPKHELSIHEGAIACWRGEKMSKWNKKLCKEGIHFDFPIHRAYKYLTDEEKALLWTGNSKFKGLNAFFKYLEENAYKIQYRVMLSRYKGRTICPDCNGSRIRKDTNYVKIAGRSLSELVNLPINEVAEIFKSLELSEYDQQVGARLLNEIESRLNTMLEVGLGYLTLNRYSNTLSGGETQRINLTRTLGSNLTESMYILDEPSIGLHPKDTEQLIKVLRKLRDLGNTVIVVEHDEAIIDAADFVVDMGPQAGVNGGELIFAGPSCELVSAKNSLTADYMNGIKNIDLPEITRSATKWIHLEGASQFNLKDVNIKVPLNALTVVSGPSGSGKTTLIKKILFPALKRRLDEYGEKPGNFSNLKGDLSAIDNIELIDQNPIGRSSRSNAVTYTKAYDAIRELFCQQNLAKIRGYKPKMFSFNVEGGRCETCKGEGTITVEMQFLADVHLQCEDCKGKRFKDEVLEVQVNGLSINDVLNLSIDEAIEFFKDHAEVSNKLKPLQDVGLGYITLGQSSSTLSGGEAQRVKLATYLGKGQTKTPILFIFDEPTTGLHFDDVKKLLKAFNELIEIGHSVLVIEHNTDVMKCSDWLIDLGPEGGKNGGHLLYQGVPKEIIGVEASKTAAFLEEKFNG